MLRSTVSYNVEDSKTNEREIQLVQFGDHTHYWMHKLDLRGEFLLRNNQ